MTNHYGLSDQVLVEIKKTLTKKLDHKTSYKIFIFGSRSKNTFRKYSDLDLWVESIPALKKNEISDLNEIFLDSTLPITIDLVTPENCLPEYLESINKDKKLWFEK